jgi:hypothetical protein
MTTRCKKRLGIFSSPAEMSLAKLSLAGNYEIMKLLPAAERLVSDIPVFTVQGASDGCEGRRSILLCRRRYKKSAGK